MKDLILKWFICLLLCLTGQTNAAEKTQQLDKANIYGDRELPKVIYIVPWKRPEIGDLVSKPVSSLLDQSIAPLDRDVFNREIDYYNELHEAHAAETSAKAVSR